MAGQWYCRMGERELGPLSSHELCELAAKSELLPTHLVRQNTGHSWIPASSVRGLFPVPPGPARGISATVSSAPRDSTSHRSWLVRTGQKTYGPFPTSELRELAANGRLKKEHEICQVGQDEWHAAHRFQGLFPAGAAVVQAATMSGVEAASLRANANAACDATVVNNLVRLRCPHCGRALKAKQTAAGRTVNCPACQHPLIIPLSKELPVLEKNASIGNSAPAALAPSRTTMRPSATADEPIEIQAATSASRPAHSLPISAVKSSWQWIKGTVQAAQAAAESRPPRGRIEFFGPGMKVDLGFGALNSPMVYATRDRYASCADASLIELPLAVRPATSGDIARLPYWPTYHDATPEQRAVYLRWLYGGRQDPTAELGYVFIHFYGLERRVLIDKHDRLPVIEELLRLLPIYGHSRSFRGYATSLLWLATALLAETGGMTEDLLRRLLRATPRWTQDARAYCLLVCAHIGARRVPVDLAVLLALPENGAPTSVIARRQPEKLHELFGKRFAARFPEGLNLKKTSPDIRIDYRQASGTLLGEHVALDWLKQKEWPNVQVDRKQSLAIESLWNECIEELRDFDRAAKGGGASTLTADMYEALPPELKTGEHPEFTAWQNLMQHCVDEAGWPVVSTAQLAEIKGISPRESLTKRQCESLLKTADSLGLAIEPDMRRAGKNYRWNQRLVVFHAVEGEPSEVDWHAYQSAAALLSLGVQVARADDESDEQELRSITRHLERQFSLPPPLQRRLEARQHLYLQGEVGDASIAKTMKRTLSIPQRQLVGEFLFEVAAIDETISNDEERLLRKLYRHLGLSEGDLESLLAKYSPSPVAAEHAESAGVALARDDDEEADDVIVAAPATTVSPRFDLERLRRIRADTLKVQELLHSALAGENDEVLAQEPLVAIGPAMAPLQSSDSPPDGQVTTPAKSQFGESDKPPVGASRFAGLAEPFRAFAEQVCQRDDWPLTELRELARKHGLMLAAALEAINEWSTARCGDWLVEENETHASVNHSLLEQP